MSDSDADPVELSASTLAALQEFYTEQKIREEKQKNVLNNIESGEITFEENWQLSQFWYNEETVDTLVNALIDITGPDEKIALISSPSLYKKLKLKCGQRAVTLFEYDQRFAVFGSDFIFYDYKSPLDIPRNLSGYFDIVIADPPFLSEECLMKTAVTIKFLTKKKIILCTGAIMEEFAERILDVKKCNFQPRHKNNLANEFSCFTNFDFDSVIKKK